MGEDFSGSCAVTSRNPLIHNGATNATWSGRFGSEVVPPCRSGLLTAAVDGLLATANFGELTFFPRTLVHEGKRGMPESGCSGPTCANP